jgi:hypothetical protein
MNGETGKPLCRATSSGRFATVVSYDDTGSGGEKTTLLFKTEEEAAECARRLNMPWTDPRSSRPCSDCGRTVFGEYTRCPFECAPIKDGE